MTQPVPTAPAYWVQTFKGRDNTGTRVTLRRFRTVHDGLEYGMFGRLAEEAATFASLNKALSSVGAPLLTQGIEGPSVTLTEYPAREAHA